jgi:ABC-2 type transport system permease protein
MAAAPTTVVAPERSLFRHMVSVWSYRELLGNLVRKELKVRYKNSALGFVWSLLNPVLYMIVFTVVFQVVLKQGIPYFPIFLLSGLLAWNLFSASLASATQSVTANAPLVNKVWFPREILPLAAVGSNSVHFVLQGTVLLLAIWLSPLEVELAWIWLLVPTLIALLLLTGAFAIFLAAVNVYARDTQHLLELLLLAWVWMTPIVYPWYLPARELAANDLPEWLVLLNPMTPIVITLQRVLYGRVFGSSGVQLLPDESQWWYLRNLGVVILVAGIGLVLATRLFGKLEGNFSEQL